MRKASLFPALIATLALWCVAVPSANALSVFDIIQLKQQGYADREIVAIIEATSSKFDLTAGDVTRLRGLGVSEIVIRRMLEATPTGAPTAAQGAQAGSSFVSPAPDTRSVPAPQGGSVQSDNYRQTNPRVITRNSAVAQTYPPVPPPSARAQSSLFSVSQFQEVGAGRHSHAAVALGGLRMFVLRDEGKFVSIDDRAWASAQGLEHARQLGRGEFHSVHVGGVDSVIFRDDAGQREVRIVSVSRRDAYAYGLRSGRHVSTDLLAAYWSALLNDYWAIAFERTPPTQIVALHEGEALARLYDRVAAQGDGGVQKLEAAVGQLPRGDRKHLERLAVAVPEDFSVGPGHEEDE